MSAWTVEMVERLIVSNRDRALCPDGVVRVNLDIAAKECAVEYVQRLNEAGEVCAAMIFAPGNKKLRVAVYPKTLELPKPICSRACDTPEDAQRGVNIGKEKFPDKYVRYFEVTKDGKYIREKDDNPTNHYFARFDTPRDHYSVEVWGPWDFLRLGLYPCWTVEEIVNRHRYYGLKGADREMKLIERAEGMTEKKQAIKEKRAAKIISEYEQQRAKHGDEVPKWFLLEEMIKDHPGTKGYSLRNLKSVLKSKE